MHCTRTRLLLHKVTSVLASSRGMIGRGVAASSGQTDKNYQEVVETLNGLQTNASVLENASKSVTSERRSRELHHMVTFLNRAGLETSDLDRLNPIHVTGTKGKGSVCAMTERILRSYGLKTGFYSSPHLREVRERIRLNGRPLSREQFVEGFWEVHRKLSASKEEHDGAMPPYFRFLTIMAFNLFLKEKVDVALIEVGIGGTFDSTNIIPNPVVCGITSLGLDHVELLGDTLEKIAWQKGGICKKGHPVYTLPQEPGPLRVLADRATELEALPLEVAPKLTDYPGRQPALSLVGDYQKTNASLAVQLSRSWLKEMGKWNQNIEQGQGTLDKKKSLHGVLVATPFSLPPQFYEGLADVRWPGRNQVIEKEGVTFYVDGAHTPKSIESSAEWFVEASAKEAEVLRSRVVKVLIFNITGKRSARTDVFLRPLVNCGFDYALFAPNIVGLDGSHSADQTNLTVTMDKVSECVRNNETTWKKLTTDGHVTTIDQSNTRVFPTLKEAVDWCTVNRNEKHSPQIPKDSEHFQVLVTGSLHLAGAFMSVLDIDVDA